jgi:hypothetical protein
MPTCGTGGRLAVALHGAGVLAVAQTPALFGGVAVAVLDTLVGGVLLIVAVTVYTAEPPAGSVGIVSLSAPLPLAVQLAPPLAAHVHVWAAIPVATGSVTRTLLADAGPGFVTVIV